MSAVTLQPAQKPIIRRSLAEGLLACTQFEREDGEQLAFGQALHSFIAAYTLLCQASGEETRRTDVARLANEAWARTPGLLQSRWQEFMDLSEHFAETRPAQLETLMHIEHTITLDVGFAILSCTVDRIDRIDHGDPDEEPRDIQTSDWKSERGEMNHEFQAKWYSQMEFLTMPTVDSVVFAVHALRDWWVPDPYIFQRGELDLWWKGTLQGLKARLDTPTAAPVGGPACPGCLKRTSCSRATAVAIAIPDNQDAADETFQETLRLEEALEVRKQGLKHWYSGHSEQVVHGKEIGFLTPREPNLIVTAEPMAVMKFLNKRHMQGSAVLKVDKAEINHGMADKLIQGGLAKREVSQPAFRWRNHVPARDERKRKKQEEASTT
jgi:hypothetical protein